MSAFLFTPHSRFGKNYIWNVYIENQIVAKVSLEHNGKIWVNVLRHGVRLVTPEIEKAIQLYGENIAKSSVVCDVCHLLSPTPLSKECEAKHRVDYPSLIIKTASGQKVNAKPTLDFYHLTEDQFMSHVKTYDETGTLPDSKKRY